MIHLNEGVNLIRLCVAVGVETAHDATLALSLPSDLSMPTNSSVDAAVRQDLWVVHQRRLREHGKVKAVRRVDTWLVGFRRGVGAFL